jgi:DNA-binding transcriptional MerR regulator
VSNRTYLSIGDVLSLLRQEFPDVTISKIRFLESQGLVNPERSPSGYRKFYNHDVERLRWVLRQQREHFLPLKVIRDRLAETDGVPSDDIEDQDDAEVGAEVGAENEAVVVPAPSVNGSSEHEPAEVEVKQPRAPEPVLAGARRGPAVADLAEDAPPAPRARPVPAAAARPPAPGASSAPTPTLAARASVPPIVGRRAEPEVPASQPPRDVEAAVAAAPPGPSREPEAPPGEAAPAGPNLTMEELCNVSGLAATEVASLEGFGLIEPTVVAGILYYDEECLTVAKLVSDFARYGIEPRHLRLYRNAVDRELGLVEQVITPLLRQRNPEARKRAVDAGADLNRLGQQLRVALVRKGIRKQFGN